MDEKIGIIRLSEPILVEKNGVSEVLFKNIELSRDDYYDKFNDVTVMTIKALKKLNGLPIGKMLWKQNYGKGFYDFRLKNEKQKEMWDFYG